ncbi:hypothetical protein D3C86_2131850 [compost metagenome]
MQLFPSDLAGHDEMGAFQHAEMLHHAEAGHRLIALKLAQRLAVALPQAVEDSASNGMRQGIEDVVHEPKNR